MIDAERAAFLTAGVSIVAASRGADGWPIAARASGCRVSADARRVTLVFAAQRSAALLESLRATGAIAAVFNEPGTHRSIQLKAADAVVGAIAPGDTGLVERYAEAFSAACTALGFAEQLTRAMVWAAPEDLVAVSFSPSRGFNQTPGPGAGAPL